MSLNVYHDPAEEQLSDFRILRLWRYWRDLQRHGRLPGRNDIDPSQIGPVLPWVFLVDATPADGFRYRLVGTRIVTEMGYDMTGQLVSRAYAGSDWEEVRQDYDWVIAQRQPCLTHNEVVLPATGATYRYSRLLLPLAADGETVDILLGAAIGAADRYQAD